MTKSTSPSWLEAARTLAAGPDPGTNPVFCMLDDRPAVTYSATRLTFKRDALERLPAHGVVIVYIRPAGETPFAVALTRADAERDFPSVFTSGSWGKDRYYNWTEFPEAARKYVL
jgi:hypothetical protein